MTRWGKMEDGGQVNKIIYLVNNWGLIMINIANQVELPPFSLKNIHDLYRG